jgi:UDP-2,3-diacylglucosamine pyrophosphatase LpxH
MKEEETKDKIKEIEFIVSDLHLGARHPDLEAFLDDDIFKQFIKMLIRKYAATDAEVTLIFNGDFFDPLAVLYEGRSVVTRYEEIDLYKIKMIIEAHPYIFNALKKFASFKNSRIKFVIGNHDLCLHWPSIQELIIKRLSGENASGIEFVVEMVKNGIYIAHGNTEYHNQTLRNPILDKKEVRIPLKRDGFEKLLKGEWSAKQKILDVPLGHHLVVALENPLKKHNLLVGHMRCHGFVWLDAIIGIGRKNKYRKHRLFAAIAVITTVWVMIKYWRYTKDRGVVIKILRVLWWTIVGALEGQTPYDEAKRLLEREDVDVVIFGHEHKPHYEIIRVGSRNKLYVNSGTWQLIREVKIEPLELKSKRFRRLERICRRIKRFFDKWIRPTIEEITEYPVVEIVHRESGNRSIRLMRFVFNKEIETWALDEFI